LAGGKLLPNASCFGAETPRVRATLFNQPMNGVRLPATLDNDTFGIGSNHHNQ